MTDFNTTDRFYSAAKSIFAVTYGACFQSEAKSLIVSLISHAYGLPNATSMTSALSELEEHDVKDVSACHAYLSATRLLLDFPVEFKICAAALRDFLQSEQNIRIFRDRTVWLRNVYCQQNPSDRDKLVKAMVCYTSNDVQSAFGILEDLCSYDSECAKMAESLLAATAFHSGDYELAYSACLRSELAFRPDTKQWVHFDNDALSSIKNEALEAIGPVKATELRDKIEQGTRQKQRIGFA